MTKLPETIDFHETDYPGLIHIFHEIDAGIAAIIASDPTLRVRRTTRRCARAGSSSGTARHRRAMRVAA